MMPGMQMGQMGYYQGMPPGAGGQYPPGMPPGAGGQ